MEKLDLTKQHKAYYSATSQPQLLDIPAAHFLAIRGKGDPSGKPYLDRIQALYATAYTIKFMNKALSKDFVVPKLEGLWNFDEEKYAGLPIHETPLTVPRSEWNYRMLIRMPDYVTSEQLAVAVQQIISKKQIRLAADVELYQMHEGKVVQMLHTGPFANEPETLQIMMDFMLARGLKKNGDHHEIYLSDFNKTAPEKLKTILREPVK
ncbi:GyrI-like domain-containing protein [Pedobacter africanus]|uniref:GyrI-like small molecule binding domain-containing protein n=1 Tax=Pedobacter africanus TaxID=151894 RepID=A0A1W1ZKW6_9SPHI|nr:GyrI-like domain-containing protein [Pedobacter africanus]SMC48862.1 hypothetical protein SAMN04488524_0811 [Pedobacter africanus]